LEAGVEPSEGLFEVLLVNAQHIKAVPGRKTDQKDSEWIADLLQHGLLRASFVPPTPIRELRDLTRYRASLAQEINRIANRIQKVLEDANSKLASVATDTLGASGRAMLEAMIQGEQDSQRLAEMAQGKLRNRFQSFARTRQQASSISAARTAGPSLLRGVQDAADRAGGRRAPGPFPE